MKKKIFPSSLKKTGLRIKRAICWRIRRSLAQILDSELVSESSDPEPEPEPNSVSESRDDVDRMNLIGSDVKSAIKLVIKIDFYKDLPSDGADRDTGGESGHPLKMSPLALGSF